MRFQLFTLALIIGLSFSCTNLNAGDNRPSAIITEERPLDEQGLASLFGSETKTVVTGYDLQMAETVGNHTYIVINKLGTTANWRRAILELLNKFETAHAKDLEVTNWHPDVIQPSSLASTPQVLGVWIDHKPRQKQGN